MKELFELPKKEQEEIEQVKKAADIIYKVENKYEMDSARRKFLFRVRCNIKERTLNKKDVAKVKKFYNQIRKLIKKENFSSFSTPFIKDNIRRIRNEKDDFVSSES